MTELSSTMLYRDLTTKELIHMALERGEGELSANGAFAVTTGSRTGRSPKDRYIVKDVLTENEVEWGNVNQPTTPDIFASLWQKAENTLKEKESFISHLRVGEDQDVGLSVTVITEFAWHNLFARHLFIREGVDQTSDWTVLNVPSCTTDPTCDGTNSDGTVMINFSEKKVLICGMRYAGEMKKAMFSVLNFLLPDNDILPMHCAANKGE
ncbi:MAG: phosphoenolpyruvate carboxykinase (ATP), partial [Coxiellaceae bacterium]|nr:phosphoenolpyruvate carboxykinase (ATP) [Coxiellaceae bacterium]